MPVKVLYDPEIFILNKKIYYKAGTATVTLGLSEKKVEAFSAGGGVVEMIHSEDVSTKIGCVKFTVTATPDYIKLIESWASIVAAIPIKVVDGSFSKTIAYCSLITNPEFQLKPESEVPLEFKGNPAI